MMHETTLLLTLPSALLLFVDFCICISLDNNAALSDIPVEVVVLNNQKQSENE